MANYECAVRTNYFHVKDEFAFKEFMKKVVCSEDDLDIFESKDEKGMTMYGFGCYGSIMGISAEGEDEDEYSYDKFIDELRKNIEPGDAIIIFEAGHEKLCSIGMCADIITSEGYNILNLEHMAVESAKNMLKNPDWETKCTC